MSPRKTVRLPAVSLVFGALFLLFAVMEIVSGLVSADVNKHNEGIAYGVLGAITGIVVIVMFVMVKYEYDERGFTYTNALGKSRDISYTEIFSIVRPNKNTLSLELRDGTAISISIMTKPAKEFAAVIEAAVAANSVPATQTFGYYNGR